MVANFGRSTIEGAFFGFEKHATYYVASVICAFEHMHRQKIIFRDLKPENVLLTEKGHAKLTDMGLAKVVVGKTFTACGTPSYFAPELIAGLGYGESLDWWTLGVLSFELMAGQTPFESPQPMEVYRKVRRGIDRVEFPAKFSKECKDFIKNLCHPKPLSRIPLKKGGINNVKNHAWLARDIQFKSLLAGTLEPPYKPRVASKIDASAFKAGQHDKPPEVEYVDDGSGWDEDFATSN